MKYRYGTCLPVYRARHMWQLLWQSDTFLSPIVDCPMLSDLFLKWKLWSVRIIPKAENCAGAEKMLPASSHLFLNSQFLSRHLHSEGSPDDHQEETLRYQRYGTIFRLNLSVFFRPWYRYPFILCSVEHSGRKSGQLCSWPFINRSRQLCIMLIC